jgi:hypothetical protein
MIPEQLSLSRSRIIFQRRIRVFLVVVQLTVLFPLFSHTIVHCCTAWSSHSQRSINYHHSSWHSFIWSISHRTGASVLETQTLFWNAPPSLTDRPGVTRTQHISLVAWSQYSALNYTFCENRLHLGRFPLFSTMRSIMGLRRYLPFLLLGTLPVSVQSVDVLTTNGFSLCSTSTDVHVERLDATYDRTSRVLTFDVAGSSQTSQNVSLHLSVSAYSRQVYEKDFNPCDLGMAQMCPGMLMTCPVLQY